MELAVNAPVYCTDGLFGHAVGLVIDPAAKRVTHVIAERKGFVQTEYLVPLDLVTAGTPGAIRVGRTRREVAVMKPFVESAYLYVGMGYEAGAIGPDAAMLDTALLPDGLYEDIPPGEREIHRYARVEARDGRVGRVDAFEVEPAGGQITHLILREGHLWGQKEVTLPISGVERIDDDAIRLSLDKAAIAALPAIPVHRAHRGAPPDEGAATARA